MKTENRFFGIELRQVGGKPHLSGIAAVYNQLSHDLGGFHERITPGAFRSCLERGDDVFCTRDHNMSKILGRTSAGTLHLAESRSGLLFDCELPDTQDGHDVEELCRRGDLREMSFGFQVDPESEQWANEDYLDEDLNERCRGAVRTIGNFKRIVDVSVVASPGYPCTVATASLRSLFWPQGVPESVAGHLTFNFAAATTEASRRLERLRADLRTDAEIVRSRETADVMLAYGRLADVVEDIGHDKKLAEIRRKARRA